MSTTLSTYITLAILLGSAAAGAQQLIYNGISLPRPWPPRDVLLTNEPAPDPDYLLHPPAVIPIDVGRQLFVDSFLIEKTDLRREFHRAIWYPGNPVLKGDRPWESGHAMPFSHGAFFDPRDGLFKLWYGSGGATLYATSRDGVHWDKPHLDVKPGTNAVLLAGGETTVWLDLDEMEATRRYKLGRSTGHARPYLLYVSADGVHWGESIAKSVPTADRTTFFRNSFRNVWIASLRDHDWVPENGRIPEKETFVGRMRRYWESPKFEGIVGYPAGEQVRSNPRLAAPLWAMADRLDPRRVDLNVEPELYNLDAVAYESLMLGMFTIWPGRVAGQRKNELPDGRLQPGWISLDSPGPQAVPRAYRKARRLELCQRAIGRWRLPGGRRPAVFLCERTCRSSWETCGGRYVRGSRHDSP